MSKPLIIDIPHALGVAEARRRIDEGFGGIERQLGGGLAQVTRHWDGDRMTFSAKVMGQHVGGRVDVLAQAIRMEIDLPAVLVMIADKVKGRVQREGQLLLGGK